MKKLLTIFFVLLSVLGFAQDSEIYCAIFNNNKNFKYLNLYDAQTKESMVYYNVLDSSFQMSKKAFKFDKKSNYTQNFADSIKLSKTIYNPEAYSDYISKISNALTIEEQNYLFNKVELEKTNHKIDFNCEKTLIKDSSSLKSGYFFQVSKIEYFNKKTKAFVLVNVYSKNEEYVDNLLGYSYFILSLIEDKWIQTFEYESIYL